MQCEVCRYEFTMREAQGQVACPRCAETQSIDKRAEEISAEKRRRLAGYSPPVSAAMNGYDGAQPVVVVDLRMSFFSMMWFMVKGVIASIPALIILTIFFFIVSVMFGGLFGALSR